MIKKIIEELSNYLPMVWPLAQWVATNPMQDLVGQPIEQVGADMQSKFFVKSTKSLFEYRQDYNEGVVTNGAIKVAIDEFLKYSDERFCSDSQPAADLVALLLFQFVLSEHAEVSQMESTLPLDLRASPPEFDSYIQQECCKWLAFYTDHSLEKSNDFSEKNEKLLTCLCKTLIDSSAGWRQFLKEMPEEPFSIIELLLRRLDVKPSDYRKKIKYILWQLKGWSGLAKWQRAYPGNPWCGKIILVEEIVALWLIFEAFHINSKKKKPVVFDDSDFACTDERSVDTLMAVWHQFVNESVSELSEVNANYFKNLAKSIRIKLNDLLWIWQRAVEIGYQQKLLSELCFEDKKKDVDSQWVFCIDVRSEGFRRHLEEVGRIETYGFAGFFGLAFELREKMSAKETCQCPALLEPNFIVKTMECQSYFLGEAFQLVKPAIDSMKSSALGAFAFYEIAGIWFSLVLLIKSFGYRWLAKFKSRTLKEKSASYRQLDLLDIEEKQVVSLEKRVSLAKGLLEGIGLVDRFAKWVVICGHRAETDNNPHQAGLDCGACGGNAGYSNAILACYLLNDKAIREQLSREGIVIPGETVFVPVCHNTTTDKIEWFDSLLGLEQGLLEQLQSLKSQAEQAGAALIKERLAGLPGKSNVQRRAQDWAELIPEWGLVNNAAMVIGPRTLTQHANLDRRVFLHSYRPEQDPTGALLESILLGPMVVAHWINIQYYFSAVDPANFGSGDKTVQNVLPSVGVMLGNYSDLQYGLSYQSVFFQDQRVHQPLRLFVVVYAEKSKVDGILSKHAHLNQLVQGRWLWLHVIEPK